MSKGVCDICPHHCRLAEGQIGFCRARSNVGGRIQAINYGLVTSIAIDPIEKKPLYRFHPGSCILSLGSFGCNLRCSFCQNYEISMANAQQVHVRKLEPEEVVNLAVSLQSKGNIGIAYTYNEPVVGYEYVYDCARLAKEKGLKNVLVTNGYCCEGKLDELLRFIDALNIDLKAFTKDFYQKISGDLETVKNSIKLAAETAHVEVANLIIPGENDSEDEIEALSAWLASISQDIPLHLTRFFPQYKMTDRVATDVDKLYRLAEIAEGNLKYVYLGNC